MRAHPCQRLCRRRPALKRATQSRRATRCRGSPRRQTLRRAPGNPCRFTPAAPASGACASRMRITSAQRSVRTPLEPAWRFPTSELGRGLWEGRSPNSAGGDDHENDCWCPVGRVLVAWGSRLGQCRRLYGERLGRYRTGHTPDLELSRPKPVMRKTRFEPGLASPGQNRVP